MVFHRTWISTIELGQLPSESWGLISTSWALSTGLFPISSGYWIQNPHVCMTCTLSSWAVFPAVLCFWQIYIYGYTCICLYMFLLGHLDKMVSLSQQSTLSLITAFDFVYFICCIFFYSLHERTSIPLLSPFMRPYRKTESSLWGMWLDLLSGHFRLDLFLLQVKSLYILRSSLLGIVLFSYWPVDLLLLFLFCCLTS